MTAETLPTATSPGLEPRIAFTAGVVRGNILPALYLPETRKIEIDFDTVVRIICPGTDPVVPTRVILDTVFPASTTPIPLGMHTRLVQSGDVVSRALYADLDTVQVFLDKAAPRPPETNGERPRRRTLIYSPELEALVGRLREMEKQHM